MPEPTATATAATATATAADAFTVDVFTAVANPARREVLRLLRDGGPRPVGELAEHFDMRRPSLSEHLRLLKDAGLVTERRVGRQRWYALEAAPLRALTDWLAPYERFWNDRIDGLADLLDAERDDIDGPPNAGHHD
ncbi:metalloregulator ArsR/SmtB family transcription factor [Actinoplanes sp. NPDC051851]|uniref:ArsR/SmtB family transcription factor n=1 Tax=Actinoplanes sp. NPDC051851 TaxID=3154753 RepID=UPI003448867A